VEELVAHGARSVRPRHGFGGAQEGPAAHERIAALFNALGLQPQCRRNGRRRELTARDARRLEQAPLGLRETIDVALDQLPQALGDAARDVIDRLFEPPAPRHLHDRPARHQVLDHQQMPQHGKGLRPQRDGLRAPEQLLALRVQMERREDGLSRTFHSKRLYQTDPAKFHRDSTVGRSSRPPRGW
jgi:hypothetical protein